VTPPPKPKRGRSDWRPPGPVPERGAGPRADDPKAVGPVLDELLHSLGAPPADALSTLFERWQEIAGTSLADHGVPMALEDGVLSVKVGEPAWSTEWRYRQGEVLRRCDELLGEGTVRRIDVRVRR
jgi:predicted nucleic acid-binding Zn ribbon protein